MKKIELFILPYAKENEIKTRLIVDGNKIDSKDNRLTNLVVYQPMRRWLNPYKKKLFVWDGFLPEIVEEFNDKSIHFVFHGCKSDYIVFKSSILSQQTRYNRNGESVDVSFELVDKWNPQKTIKALVEVLDDLRVEADNWGEDGIIKEIDALKKEVSKCKVSLTSAYISDDNFSKTLQKERISITDDAVLSLIPVDGTVATSDIQDYIANMAKDTLSNKMYIVVNTLMQENTSLIDVAVALDNEHDLRVKYIENDSENYMKDVVKLYYLLVLPNAMQKASEILHMYPDYDTNSFLIDVSDRIDDLFTVKI